MESTRSAHSGGLKDLAIACDRLSQDFRVIANSLNTAPITLAYLAKECKSIADALGRLETITETTPQVLDHGSELVDSSYGELVQAISTDISTLKLTSARLRHKDRDSGVDVSMPQLIIIWNEDSLKDIGKNLEASRASLMFLLDCVPMEHGSIAVNPSATPTSGRISPASATNPALRHKSSRLGSSTITFQTPVDLLRVSELPGVRSALEELRPDPGMVYKQSTKTCLQLHHAIDRRDDATVMKLLLGRADPNSLQSGSTISPLHRAFNRKSSSIATFLAVAGADLDEPNNDGETAMIRGIKCGFPDKFTSLLCELGARVDAVDNMGCSALHHAASSKNEDDSIAVLVHVGGDINSKDFNGRTPLIAAVEKSRHRSAETLIEYGADLEVRLPNDQTALHVAISTRNVALTKVLAYRGANVDCRFNDHTALTFAISIACTDIAEVLIESGADVNLRSSKGNFPLLAAAGMANVKITNLLLSRKAKMKSSSTSGYCPIHMAAHKNRIEILRLLVEAGSPIDPITEQKDTPLSIAVHLGYPDVARYLIQAGANVNHMSHGGERIICQALKSGNAQIATALVEGGAELTRPIGGEDSMSPVHLAAQLGLDDVFMAMVNTGSDLETTIWPGHTPLFSAVDAGHLSTARLLLSTTANKKAVSDAGQTALFFGTADAAMVKLLVDAGIDVNHRDQHGATALHYAALHGNLAGVKALLQKGAKVFHANAVFDTLADYREGTVYRQGTAAGLAMQKGHAEVERLIEGWKFKN